MSRPIAIIITGPTASGKSALAVNLAHKLKTDIISADSRQIYKGIPIVTAVPTLEEREGVKHHLMECLELNEYYSASRFEEDALSLLKDLFKEKETAIVCGGSMLYIDALMEGIDKLPTIPPLFRENLMNEWHNKGNNWLLNQLEKIDPDYFAKIDHRNLKRIFHALEVSLIARKPYSSLLKQKKAVRDFDILKICLTGEREYLFHRINQRVIDMISKGLEEEARSVYHIKHFNSLNTVGLKEMFAYFDGDLDRETAISRIQKNTRVYAKKQETWHKRDKKAVWLDFATPPDINSNKIIKLMKEV